MLKTCLDTLLCDTAPATLTVVRSLPHLDCDPPDPRRDVCDAVGDGGSGERRSDSSMVGELGGDVESSRSPDRRLRTRFSRRVVNRRARGISASYRLDNTLW